mgnify:CR=1 FL=1
MADFNSLMQIFRKAMHSAPQQQMGPMQQMGQMGPQAGPQLPAMMARAPAAVQEWGQQLSELYPEPQTEQNFMQSLQDMTDPNKSEIYRKLTELLAKLKR